MKYIFLVLMIVVNVFSFTDETGTSQSSNETGNEAQAERNELYLNSLQKSWIQKENKSPVKVVKYKAQKVQNIATRIGMKTTIILPHDEKPIAKFIGDTSSFKFEFLSDIENSHFNLDNYFTIMPSHAEIDTNVIIIGSSGRTYNFYVYSLGQIHDEKPNTTVYITLDGKMPKPVKYNNEDLKAKMIVELNKEILQLQEKLDIKEEKKEKDLNKFDISSIQFDYELPEKNEFMLEAIFNDREYTYFKFKENFIIPKIYYIDDLKDKINLEFSIYNNILKVKKLATNWSLEIGTKILRANKINNFEFGKPPLKKFYVDMTKTHFNFTKKGGSENIEPIKIFHDAEYTYFKFNFENGFKKFPTFYRVIDGYDNPVNFEIIGDFVVVKVLHKAFTLRLDKEYYCVRLEDE